MVDACLGGYHYCGQCSLSQRIIQQSLQGAQRYCIAIERRNTHTHTQEDRYFLSGVITMAVIKIDFALRSFSNNRLRFN